MTNNSVRTQELEQLRSFGLLIAQIHERTFSILQSELADTESGPRSLVGYLNRLDNEQTKILTVAQFALESGLHDLLFAFQEAFEFRVQGKTEDGTWFDLARSSWGLQGALMDWLDEQSRFGGILGRIAEANLESSARGSS
jgi:hypothetical protein